MALSFGGLYPTVLTMGFCSTIAAFSEADRRTLLLVLKYQAERNRRSIWGYEFLDLVKLTPAILEDAKFKAFATVRKWIENDGWTISWKHLHWQGFVRFVFDQFPEHKPPWPGQLRNKKLLRQYLRSVPKAEPTKAIRTEAKMCALYARIIVKEDLL